MRVAAEIGEHRCWITKGKEIENYLRPATIQQLLDGRFEGNTRPIKFDKDTPIEKAMRRAVKSGRAHYSKVRDARELADLMTEDDLGILDLRQWINRMISTINSWNAEENE